MEVKLHTVTPTGKSVNSSSIPKGCMKLCFVYCISLMGLLGLLLSSISCWEHRETLSVQAPTMHVCVCIIVTLDPWNLSVACTRHAHAPHGMRNMLAVELLNSATV